jgi:hypothetical protein
MDDRRADRIHRLIHAIAGRSDAEGRDLARAFARRCWPVATGDRHEPIAREWLRRWSPRPAALPAPACSCHSGHCLVCN